MSIDSNPLGRFGYSPSGVGKGAWYEGYNETLGFTGNLTSNAVRDLKKFGKKWRKSPEFRAQYQAEVDAGVAALNQLPPLTVEETLRALRKSGADQRKVSADSFYPNLVAGLAGAAKKSEKKRQKKKLANPLLVTQNQPISPQIGEFRMPFGLTLSSGSVNAPIGGSYDPYGGFGGGDPTAVPGFDWGGLLQTGLGAVGGYLTAKEQSKAARDMAKAAASARVPQFGGTGFVGPLVGGVARQLPGILAGGVGAVAADAVMSGPPSVASNLPRVITQPRQLKSGRWTVDTWVRAPKETGTLRVVRRKNTCRRRPR